MTNYRTNTSLRCFESIGLTSARPAAAALSSQTFSKIIVGWLRSHSKQAPGVARNNWLQQGKYYLQPMFNFVFKL